MRSPFLPDRNDPYIGDLVKDAKEDKMSKYTPGPWKVCFYEPFLRIQGHAIKTDDAIERPIATLWAGGGTKGKPTQKANAHLIAAAPELLEACKLALGYCWKATSDNPEKILEQAIAKAEKIK